MVLFQVCAVVSTLALVTLSVGLTMLFLRIRTLTQEVGQMVETVKTSTTRIETFINEEAVKVVRQMHDVIPPIRRAAESLEAVGERTARLSHAVLEEVEAPVRTAVAVLRGVRAGTDRLFQTFTRRSAPPKTHYNGGHDHV